MRSPITCVLVALLWAAALGCGQRSPQAVLETTDVVAEPLAIPAAANEAVLIYYSSADSPLLTEMWLPPDTEGATLVRAFGDPATKELHTLTFFREDEQIAELRLGLGSPVGTAATFADGTTAVLEATDGRLWTWVVTRPSGAASRTRITMPLDPIVAASRPDAIRPVALQQEYPSVPGWAFDKPVVQAIATSYAPLDVRRPDGEPPGGFVPTNFATEAACRASEPGVECTFDVVPSGETLRLSSWTATDLSSLPEGTRVYGTVADCQAAQERIGNGGVAAGALIGLVTLLEASTLAGNVVGFAAGLIVSITANANTASCVELMSNEAIRNAAFDPHDGVVVQASLRWQLHPEAEARGWRVEAAPADITLQPFLTANRGDTRLPPVVVTINHTASPSAPVLVGSRFSGTRTDAFLGTQRGIAPLARDPLAELTVLVDSADRVTLVFNVRYFTSALIHCAEAFAQDVPLSPEGTFVAQGIDLMGGRFARQVGCGQHLLLEGRVTIEGQVDAVSGQGYAIVRDEFEDALHSYEFALRRE